MEGLINKVDSSTSLKYGSYTIHLSGTLLLLFFRGTWSERCAANYIRDVSRFRKEHNLTRFASINIISEWQLGTPEAINMVSDVLRRKGAKSGIVAQFLLSDSKNQLSVVIARQAVELALPGAKAGTALDDFLPELSAHGINFNEKRVRSILAANGRCH